MCRKLQLKGDIRYMNIGEALKKIRIQRDLSQKEMCHNLITTSYYSKVERGVHKISADNLFIILQKNNISTNEFLELVNLDDIYNDSINTAIANEIEQAYYQFDTNRLEQLKKNLNTVFNKDDYNYKFYNSLITLTLVNIKQDLTLLSVEEKDFFKQKIFSMNNWDSFRLSLYNNMIDFYDLDSNISIINSIVSKPTIIEREPLLVETIIINFIGFCIENNNDNCAKSFFVIVDSISTKPDNFFNKNMFTFFKNLIYYRESQNDLFLDPIFEAIKIFNFLAMPEYGTNLKLFYEKNKQISE